MKKKITILITIFIFNLFLVPVSAQTRDLLSNEEALWLKERNNTIVVYPEQNNPPYSYQSPSGNIQGLSIDYIELIAEKIGAKIQYLTPRSRNQINSDMQAGKGDVAFLTMATPKEEYLLFTESYATVPVVIVVRKDYKITGGNLTLNDFNGKKVAMISGSSIESYVNMNYPRVVREGMTDNEVSLQQVVLGEVDAAVMDVASLSFYLSKQVLSSVKIAGNTGLDYKPSFAVTKNKAMLQSILEKGLSQISINDRALFIDKWVALPGESKNVQYSFLTILKDNLSITILYILFGIGLGTVLILVFTRKHHRERYFRKVHEVDDLKDEFAELEGESSVLTQELLKIKLEEQKLKEKIESIQK